VAIAVRTTIATATTSFREAKEVLTIAATSKRHTAGATYLAMLMVWIHYK